MQKNDQKSLKNHLATIHLFIRYIDISKIKLQQQLNRIQSQLHQLEVLETAHYQSIIKTIGKKQLHQPLPANHRDFKKLYLLVDGKNDDDYTRYLYQKMAQDLAHQNRDHIAVVTFGYYTNRLAAQLGLKIIKHYDYATYQNLTQFQELVANLCELVIKNRQSDQIELIVCQPDLAQHSFVKMQLFPFVANHNPNYDLISAAATRSYLDVITNFNYQKATYYANIVQLVLKTHKLITKEQIGQLNLRDQIAQIKMKLQQLEDKLDDLMEEAKDVALKLNRLRREASTAATLLLYSAFKTHHRDHNMLELIRKKPDEDNWFIHKGVN